MCLSPKNLLILLAFAEGAVGIGGPVPTANAAWTFDGLDGNSMKFRDGEKSETLKIDSASPKFITTLVDPDSSVAYVLYEAKTCPSCEDSNTSLFIRRIDGKGKAAS